jgi:hypothetical protein
MCLIVRKEKKTKMKEHVERGLQHNGKHFSHIQTKIVQNLNRGLSDFPQERLIDYLRFYVPLKNFSLIWRRHHCR